MTIKELKSKKQVNAIRRDNHFKSDAEKQKDFEDQLKADGWKISGYVMEAEGIRYSLFMEEPEQHRWYCKPENEKEIKQKAYRYLHRFSLPVAREYRDGDFIVLETSVTRLDRYLPLNRAELKNPEVAGVLVFRSKDYVFKFKDAEGYDHEIYGAALKKDMIQGDVIHYENERGVNIDYVIQ